MPQISEEQRRYDMGYATGYQKGREAGRAEVGIKVKKDGDQYCALVGENLQEGIAGFGVTPASALMNLMLQNADTLNAALGGEDISVTAELGPPMD